MATVIHDFKDFINQNVDALPALQILCSVPEAQGVLTEDNLKMLEEALQQHSNSLSRESLWLAYKRRSPEKVRGGTEKRTDLISLVRFAMGYKLFLEPFSATVNRNFEEWLAGKHFSVEQHKWLEMICDHIATSLDIRMSDFELAPFEERGNGAKVYQLFGDNLDNILKSLTKKLVS